MAVRSLRAFSTGAEKAREALIAKAWSQENLASRVGVSRQTVVNFYGCKPVDRQIFVQICQQLVLPWQEIADLPKDIEPELEGKEQTNTDYINPLVQKGRSLQASPEGIEKAKRALFSDSLTQKALAQDLGITRQPISKFFTGKPVDRNLFVQICENLHLKWEEVVAMPLSEPESLPDFPDRPVSPQSPFYMKRFYSGRLSVEALCSQKVLQPGALIRIKGPKKMGKTSLLNQILAEAEHSDYRTIRLNLQQAEESIFDNLDHFLQWFCTNISQKLNLESRLDDYWDNEKLGSMTSCTSYFQAYLLEQIDTPLVLGLDEVDRLFEYEKIAKAFFALLRSWHEDANNLEVWQKLRLVVTYSTEVYIPLDVNSSPFNVGLPIKLTDLTLEQVQQLAREYGLKWLTSSEAEQLCAMVGGHPYLIQLALYHLHQGAMTFKQLLLTASTAAGIYSSYLQSLWIILKEHSELLEALRTLLKSNVVQLEPILAYKLEGMGIVQFERNQVKFSCQLYSDYFSSCLRT